MSADTVAVAPIGESLSEFEFEASNKDGREKSEYNELSKLQPLPLVYDDVFTLR